MDNEHFQPLNPSFVTEVKQSFASQKVMSLFGEYNPLLFDFVLKRTMKFPGTTKRLPASIFMTSPELGI